MKLKKIVNLMVLGTTLTIAAAGCRHTEERKMVIPGNRPTIGKNDSTLPDASSLKSPKDMAINSGALHELGEGHVGWGEDPSNPLRGETVLFDYDKSAIRAGEQSKLERVADYLRSHSEVALRIDGHCDERGTDEYNRSLGARRAASGRETLIRLGIDPTRIDTNTYGKDKPADTGHDDAAHAKNRRDEFIVLLPPK